MAIGPKIFRCLYETPRRAVEANGVEILGLFIACLVMFGVKGGERSMRGWALLAFGSIFMS